jgi:hypothetical protein
MGGVGASPSPCFPHTTGVKPGEHDIEEHLFRSPRHQACPKLGEDRGVKARIGALQPPGIRPVDTTAHGVGRLAIGEPFGELQERDECQAPGGQRGLSVRGEERQKGLISKQAIQFIGCS